MADPEDTPGEGGKDRALLSKVAVGVGVPSAAAAAVLGLLHAKDGLVLSLVFLTLVSFLALAAPVVRGVLQPLQNLVVGRVSAGMERQLSGFDRRYRDHLLTRLRHIDTKGLRGQLTYTPELSEVYVDVALAGQNPGKMPSSDLQGAAPLPPVGQRRPIGAFLDGQEPRVLAVIGAPGTGKT